MNEAENTFRVLADEPPIVTSFWCRFGIHTWEQWSNQYQPNAARKIFMQHKGCIHCNIYVTRHVKLPDGI